ncbi:MAG: hypothetical protein CYG60_10425 [Actinobacteria bacterium]|nr:MAG: hypothetical protein CYG60_10425 [Actinomycetota bacterium]
MTRAASLTIDTNVGDRIFLFRQAHGMSQSELSRRSGVNRTSVVFAENGRNVPRPSTLRKLAGAFGVTVEEFLNGEVPGRT